MSININNSTIITNHYDDFYFSNFQKEIGEFAGKESVFMFNDSISESDTVLDFGCGGGFLLQHISCKNKIGIELNAVARQFCNEVNQIICFESLRDIENESVDVVISNHCLEHVTSPYEIITELYKKLKPGGKIVIVVPVESYKYKWVPNDINNHLYSFSPMNIGNLLQGANFKKIQTNHILHKWPPNYKKIYSVFGSKIFHLIAWIYGTYFNKKFVQIRGQGVK